MVENVRLYGLQEFRASHRLLQNVREHFSKRPMFRKTGLLALLVLAVEQVDVYCLADEVSQILARKFDETGAEENVIMDVVDPER